MKDHAKKLSGELSESEVMDRELKMMNETYMKNYESNRQGKINKWLFVLLVFLLVTVAIQFYLLNQKSEGAKSLQNDLKIGKDTIVPPDVSIRDWDPFDEFQRMQKRMDRFFEKGLPGFDSSLPNLKSFSFGGGAFQNHKIEDEGDHFTVTLELPGLNQTQLNVNVEDQSLKISGSMEYVEETRNDESLIKSHRSQHFERYLTLPGPVDPATLQVNYNDSTLKISVDKLPT